MSLNDFQRNNIITLYACKKTFYCIFYTFKRPKVISQKIHIKMSFVSWLNMVRLCRFADYQVSETFYYFVLEVSFYCFCIFWSMKMVCLCTQYVNYNKWWNYVAHVYDDNIFNIYHGSGNIIKKHNSQKGHYKVLTQHDR